MSGEVKTGSSNNDLGNLWSSALFSRLDVSTELELTVNSTFIKLIYISTQ